MRKQLVPLIISLFAGASVVPANAQIGVSDTCNCPHRVGWPDNVRRPLYTDANERLSPDGKKIAFLTNTGDAGAYVLDLQTLKRTRLIGQGGLDGEYDYWWGNVSWCPYDPDLVAFNVEMTVNDTIGGHSNFFTYHVFKNRISSGETWLISPDTGGPHRHALLQGFEYGTNNANWLMGSEPGVDSFLIAFGSPTVWHQGFFGIYVPQTHTMIERVRPHVTGLDAISHDHKDSVWGHSLGIGRPQYWLDSQVIQFPFAIDSSGSPVQWASFSPNDKLIALAVDPFGMGFLFPDTNNNTLVLIYKVSDPSSPLYVLNFQKLFCTYDAACPEFITDSTLAVSMHKDGDSFAPLWEITIDGRLIRQLTFLPEVAVHSIPDHSIGILQNSGHLKITGEQQNTSCRIVSLLGTEFLSQRGTGTLDINLSQIPAGIYFAVITAGEQREVRKIAVVH